MFNNTGTIKCPGGYVGIPELMNTLFAIVVIDTRLKKLVNFLFKNSVVKRY